MTIDVVTCTPAWYGAFDSYLASKRPHKSQRRLLSLLAWDSQQQTPAGCLAVDEACAAYDHEATVDKLTSLDAEGLGYNTSNTAYVHCFKVQDDMHVSVTLKLLQRVFISIPTLAHLLLVSHTELQGEQHAGLTAYFSKVMHSSSGLWMYSCNRRAVLPPLQVRRAVIEDHDDLLPILAAGAAGRCPSLAALPDSCSPAEPYALTRLIGSQDSQNVVLVAQDHGKLVGLLVATSQLDVGLLHQSFDLGVYHGFMPAEVYEDCEAAAQVAAMNKAQARVQEDVQDEARETAEGAEAAAPAPPSAAEVHAELLPVLQDALHQHGQKGHTLMAVTMLCMLSEYENRAVDFIQPLFGELPSKDYCALSLPHCSPEPPVAQLMSRLTPLPGSLYQDVLLVMNRVALLQREGGLQVRLAEPDDVVALYRLVGGLANAVKVQEAFLYALGRQGAVVATVQGDVIGMAATTPTADLNLLKSSFRLDVALPAGCCADPQGHAELDVCVLNPMFASCARPMLAGVLQLIKKSYLHYALLPGQPVPDWLSIMQQQPPRHRLASPGAAAEFSLFSFSKDMTYAGKQVVNSQIIIVGASETALSCLEHLLTQPHMTFTNLVLLAPGGVSVGGVACSYTASLVTRLGLEASVTIVDGHMTAVDTTQQLIELDDGSQLPYDRLIITTGLQDQLGSAIASAYPEAAQFVLSSQQLLRSTITPEAASSLSSVLIYGADLQALDVIAALTEAGMPSDAITWVCPDLQQEHPSLQLLLSLAAQLQVEVPAPQQGQLLDLVPTQDGIRAVAALQAAGDTDAAQQLELDLLVGCGRHGPSATVARCLEAAGLVWDGRLVVDANYQTHVPTVTAAGPVAKFSRRYTSPEVMLEHYSSPEVGASLAASLVRSLTAPSSPASQQECSRLAQADQLPSLHQGKVLGCKLPGGQAFAFAGCPAAVAKPALTPPPGGRSLISRHKAAPVSQSPGTARPEADNKESQIQVPATENTAEPAEKAEGLVVICLDGDDVIHYVAYLGSQAPAADKLANLVGLQFNYLAGALQLPARQGSLVAASGVGTRDGDTDANAGSGRETSHNQGLLRSCNVSMRGVEGVLAEPEPGVYVLQQDILAKLAEPWAQWLFQDGASELRRELLQQCGQLLHNKDVAVQASGESGIQEAVEEKVQHSVVQYIQNCGADLRGYKVALDMCTMARSGALAQS